MQRTYGRNNTVRKDHVSLPISMCGQLCMRRMSHVVEHHLDNITEDQVMNDAADEAIEEAKARSVASDAEVPEFIKAEKKGKGQTATWFKGSKTGMVFKIGDKGLGYYKEQPGIVIKLAPEVRPMQVAPR